MITSRESSTLKIFPSSAVLLLGPLLLLPVDLASQARKIIATIDVSKTGAPISKYIYGQFLEHGGDIVNTGVWSEMLVDRKFFFPIATTAAAPPRVVATVGGGNPRFRGAPTRWWAPIGGADAVTMDTKSPYTGDQSPLVTLDGKEARGFGQGGIAVRKGKAYTGRIVLAGSPDAQVNVTLIWGKEPSERQDVTIRGLGSVYRKFPLRYTAKTDTDDARLEITGRGTGAFHVGAISLMPSDNIEGYRPEVIAVLKQLHFGVLRFPGGNFVSAYEWRYGVGDIDKRPPIFDPVWHTVQPNDVGTDEFLTLCRLLGVDPYITVNAGLGDAWSARELVEYTNGAATTPMGKRRAENGHPHPYGVKFWGVGNEPWGDYQMGSMALPQFELKHNLFAKEMKKVDPSIKLIAGGAMPDVMEGADQARRINGQYIPDYLSAADWTGQMLLNCLDDIDMVSEHYYASGSQHTDITLQKKVPIDPPLSLIEWERAPAVQVRAKYEHYQEYLKRIPGLRAKPVPIAIDEWAYFGGNRDGYKVVPAYAWAFHEMFRHSDVFQMGLVGHSMGGYGASRIGMKHPDVFGALYIMSPCCMSPMTGGGPGPADQMKERAIAGEKKAADAKSPSDLAAQSPGFGAAQYATAAAWAPNPKNPPLYFDLPTKDGVPQPELVAKYSANAPLAFVDQYIGNLKQYRAISMDVGDQDGLRFDATKLHNILDNYGIANSFEIYSGTHVSAVADRFQNHVLPFFSKNLCFTATCK